MGGGEEDGRAQRVGIMLRGAVRCVQRRVTERAMHGA